MMLNFFYFIFYRIESLVAFVSATTISGIYASYLWRKMIKKDVVYNKRERILELDLFCVSREYYYCGAPENCIIINKNSGNR